MISSLFLTCVFVQAEPLREVLIDSTRNINVTDCVISSEAVTPSASTPWKVTKRRLAGGKQEGVDVITIWNGVLEIVVVPTRGMGIWNVTMGDLRLGWDSPVQEIVHPQFVNLTARGGLGWLDGFGEFMCRCGLENNGHPGEDVLIDNTGAESTMALTLHGKQAYIPASQVVLEVERQPPYRLRLRGQVRERMMHGPKFDLETEISTAPGEKSFRIADVITNGSTQPAEYQILYHMNFGQPLLTRGSEFIAPLARVVPFNDEAAKGEIRDFAKYQGPTPGFVEQVYCVELHADKNHQTKVALVNPERDAGVSLQFSTTELPYLTLWKNTTALEDGYVTGIEPGTGYPYNRRLERIAGRVPKLGPNERVTKTIDVTIAEGDDVATMVREIESIAALRPTDFQSKPNPPRLPESKD